MIMGNFKLDQASGAYAGEIKTLTFLREKVLFRLLEEKSSKGPDYRVVVDGTPGAVELGAAWKRTSEENREYLSVRLGEEAAFAARFWRQATSSLLRTEAD